MALYHLDDPGDLESPLLVAAFDGWVDAGSASTTATEILAEDSRVIARFDSDRLYDYRSRRPTLEIVDGRPTDLEWPELLLRRSRSQGRDVLILGGPEPDDRWQELAMASVELARTLNVAEWISLGAIPAAVPHTRPVPIIGTASRPGLLRGEVQAGPVGVLRVPSAVISVIDFAISRAGIPTVGYFAQVPHYLTGAYPAAAMELLRAVGRHLGKEPDLGSLPEQARQLRERLDTAAAADETTKAYVGRLEAMVDEEGLPTGDELISEIERFLRDRGQSEQGPPQRPAQ
jgi:hypothetical protein